MSHLAGSPADPDLDPPAPRPALWGTLAAISLGGVLGALVRYGIGEAFPHGPDGFPWATLGINVGGCLLMGVLMVVITEVRTPHPLVRPFLGVGVLGGFTTFSTYVVDAQQAVRNGAPHVALAYLAATLVCALAAVFAGMRLTRLAARR